MQYTIYVVDGGISFTGGPGNVYFGERVTYVETSDTEYAGYEGSILLFAPSTACSLL
jgi:hypothetical protein